MVQLKSSPHCAGCGVQLQIDDIHKLGYLPEQAREREPLICQRCYRMKHYNESSRVTLDHQHFLQLLGQIGQTQALVVHIIDILDIEGTWISSLTRFVGQNPVILVVNKIDLLPKVTNHNKLINWIQRVAKEQALKVVDIILVSAKKNIGFDRVIQSLKTHKRKLNVYVVGATNVGKSTLINRLIADFSDLEAELTTSMYPGTTLDLVKIPIADGTFVIDTPGIVYDHRLIEYMKPADLAVVMPDKPIKPMVFQLNDKQTLFIGALARVDFVTGDRQSFTVFMSNALHIHRTKLERADEVYIEHKGKMLAPPHGDDVDQLPKWVRHPIRIAKGKQMDIAISGLGWVKVNGDIGADLVVHAPKGIKVLSRLSLI
jgi:ribosome biogenesis GTPase YqeH